MDKSLATATDGCNVEELVKYWWIQPVLYAFVMLELPDLLATSPRDVSNLAKNTQTHEPSLYRFLKALASIGVIIESKHNTFSTTPFCDRLRQHAPQSLREAVILSGEPWYRRAWEQLTFSLETGRAAFDCAHGESLFDYLASDSHASECFNQALRVIVWVDFDDFTGAAAYR